MTWPGKCWVAYWFLPSINWPARISRDIGPLDDVLLLEAMRDLGSGQVTSFVYYLWRCFSQCGRVSLACFLSNKQKLEQACHALVCGGYLNWIRQGMLIRRGTRLCFIEEKGEREWLDYWTGYPLATGSSWWDTMQCAADKHSKHQVVPMVHFQVGISYEYLVWPPLHVGQTLGDAWYGSIGWMHQPQGLATNKTFSALTPWADWSIGVYCNVFSLHVVGQWYT